MIFRSDMSTIQRSRSSWFVNRWRMILHSQKPKYLSFYQRGCCLYTWSPSQRTKYLWRSYLPLTKSRGRDFSVLEEDKINIYTNAFSPTWQWSLRMSHLHIFFCAFKKPFFMPFPDYTLRGFLQVVQLLIRSLFLL